MKIAIITLDTFGKKMAGPAIRVWEMAGVLCHDHDVTVFSFGSVTRAGNGFELRETQVENFQNDLGTPDIVIFQGYLAQTFPWLLTSDWYTVVDLYDPFHIESLLVQRFLPMDERLQSFQYATGELTAQVSRGDFFLCASDKQRDMWLGYLGACKRLNPYTFDADASMRKLIDVASFGISSTPPVKTRSAIRGAVPGIEADDKVIIWGGGVYNWFDPLTVIRAVDQAREQIPNIRLFFMGAQHPNPDVPEMQMLRDARKLADDLGLTGTHVFFNEQWVDYADRHNYLLDADLGVSAHLPGLETDFSFRTRMLDYLWAGLPMVSTAGDFFADLIDTEDLGATVPMEDADAMAVAFVSLLSDDAERAACAQRVRDIAVRFHWESTLRALVDYCSDPWFAADREITQSADAEEVSAPVRPTVAMLARKAVRTVREQGIRHTAARVRNYLKFRR
ncbi:glycosyltransferase family 4 protein [Trueperella bialowiezensis]|uniref:GDP-mannose-dependent alpha-(1-2)-phosphatidylinositol mannosyltransferase n=1 Tax=Trueperella bialowiezensis TaxID=312285 RepID=A0A3S4V672_9ACTO|nr:glycosyltransferase family 4 protein [Trueperella bialowiezensis]VEI12915.1 GDP-mannose-dependent alpha-(1-2)-phosphatidylinositol mannosyltransferase [Trueperella bialowiezensis]